MDNPSKKIHHVAPAFWPATYWGGPIFSTKAICDGIQASRGFSVALLTTDAAGQDPEDRVVSADPLGYPVQRAKRIAGHSISPDMLIRLPRFVASADLVHLTATYSFPTLPVLALARIFGRPVVWSLRGAVQATAEWPASPNRWIKRRFEDFARLLAPRRMVLHVTSQAELEASSARLRGYTCAMIPNSVDIPDVLPGRVWRPDGKTRLLFLSRLHEKKGIEVLIDVVRHLPQGFELNICGTGDPDYVAALRARADDDPRIIFSGEVTGQAKEDAFAVADIFVLPSFSENFGIAIAEALARAVPVVTTVFTPWSELEEKGAGRNIHPKTDELRQTLLDLVNADLAAMGAKGRQWMQDAYSQAAMTEKMRDLYLRILDQSEGSK